MDRFILKFDGNHRMWFTLDGAGDIILPSMSSAAFKQSQIKSVKVESDGNVRSLKVTVKFLSTYPLLTLL